MRSHHNWNVPPRRDLPRNIDVAGRSNKRKKFRSVIRIFSEIGLWIGSSQNRNSASTIQGFYWFLKIRIGPTRSETHSFLFFNQKYLDSLGRSTANLFGSYEWRSLSDWSSEYSWEPASVFWNHQPEVLSVIGIEVVEVRLEKHLKSEKIQENSQKS